MERLLRDFISCNIVYILRATFIAAVFPLRKFYTAQMCVSVRMRLRNHVDTQPVKLFKGGKGNEVYIRYYIWNASSTRERDFTA